MTTETTTLPPNAAAAFTIAQADLERAEDLAARIASDALTASDTPAEIHKLCQAAGWKESRLTEEVERYHQVTACKDEVAASEHAHALIPKIEADKNAECLHEAERVKEHIARIQSLVKKEHELSRLHSGATKAWALLRHELLPRRHRDEIAALTEQLLPLNRDRARLGSQIHELEFEIPVDQEILAQTTAPGGKQKHKDAIAARNERRASLRRDLEPMLKTVKAKMQALLAREEELRSTYVIADPWSAAKRA